ncbi:hypothetical protein ACLUXI_03375 [Bifidobacterium apri]
MGSLTDESKVAKLKQSSVRLFFIRNGLRNEITINKKLCQGNMAQQKEKESYHALRAGFRSMLFF